MVKVPSLLIPTTSVPRQRDDSAVGRRGERTLQRVIVGVGCAVPYFDLRVGEESLVFRIVVLVCLWLVDRLNGNDTGRRIGSCPEMDRQPLREERGIAIERYFLSVSILSAVATR